MEKVHTDLMATGGRRDPLQVSVKASLVFQKTKLGLNWRILMQNWARVAIDKPNPDTHKILT